MFDHGLPSGIFRRSPLSVTEFCHGQELENPDIQIFDPENQGSQRRDLDCPHCVVCAGAATAQPTSRPNFSPDDITGWVPLNYGDSFVSPAAGPGPVVDDARYPFVSNQTSARTGKRSINQSINIPTFFS
jgi:hypothetical protein